MLWPFKKSVTSTLSCEANLLLHDLNKVLQKAPKDNRTCLERIGPYAKSGPPIDALTEVSVYMAYGHIEEARNVLAQAINDPERIKELGWLNNGESYAKELLSKLEQQCSAF